MSLINHEELALDLCYGTNNKASNSTYRNYQKKANMGLRSLFYGLHFEFSFLNSSIFLIL